MKKNLLLLVFTAILTVGCQDDSTTDNHIGNITNEGNTTLDISIANTRISLGDKQNGSYPVYWSEGDKIAINGISSEKIQINENDKSRAFFSFNQTLKYPYAITYPYSTATSAQKAIVEFPAKQNYVENSFDTNSSPMCGYVTEEGDVITLSHLAGALRIPMRSKYENTILEKIVITSTTGGKLAGEFSVDCKNAKITPTEKTQSSITYTLPSNFKLSQIVGTPFYFSVPAGYIGESKIEFIEVSGAKMVCYWSPATPVKAGIVREFKGLTYEYKAGGVLEPLPTEEDEFTVFYKRIYGHVRYSDGSPISGVAVSDGFQVVSTDSNGYYELKNVTPQSWYIYCSIPADVKVPIDEFGRPCYFKKYPSNSPCYDFTFEKLAGGKEKKFSIFAIADTQPGNTDQLNHFIAHAAPDIKSYSKSLSTPCYGVVLGDLVNSKPQLMESMRDELAYNKTGIPIFAVMGNHDHISYNSNNPVFPDERNGSYVLKIQRGFEECFGPVNFSFNRGDAHIIGMRNVKHTDNISVSSYTTGFTTEQYEWLKQDLALVPKDKMVILCVHIPILNGGKNGDGSYRQEILTLMDQYAEAHVLSGHTHYMRPYDHVWHKTGHKIYEHCISSTRQDMLESNIHRDGTPCGYAILEANGSSFVDWYYKGFTDGMTTRDDQMRIYRGGTIIGAEPTDTDKYGTMGYYQLPFDNGTLLANIYSSDPSWNVEVYEDGNYSGKMTYFYNLNDSEYDKLVGDGTYENPRRVADGVECSRDFWAIGILFGHLGSNTGNNYNTCFTMWKYTLKNPNAKHIEVRATDRFGYVYSEDTITDNTNSEDAFYKAK
ncbi:MAG: calcineurin-like phosphoesterase C-terminal domain-containing protein [Alistipes sp.]|nr:calcineurin-like phosphoesterase C-terminal domain-containing protein [Alistipes sp.]